MWTVFGPVNVALHAMSLEMETGEAAEALRMADEIDTSALPSRERQTTFARRSLAATSSAATIRASSCT
jgi:hypothetical protein